MTPVLPIAPPSPVADPGPEPAMAPDPLRLLARLAAAVAAGDAAASLAAASELAGRVPRRAAEEAVLQTYLFAGFPAAIEGLAALERAWPPPLGRAPEELAGGWEDWRARGEELCARVYGERYPRLRARMRELHPALDEWMVVEGYGKTLSRPGLSPAAREICAVAALAARGAARQLEAHLRGATAVGLEPALACAAAREAALRHAPQDRRAELEACLRRADGTRA